MLVSRGFLLSLNLPVYRLTEKLFTKREHHFQDLKMHFVEWYLNPNPKTNDISKTVWSKLWWL